MSKVILWGIVAFFVGMASFHVAGPLILSKIQNVSVPAAPAEK